MLIPNETLFGGIQVYRFTTLSVNLSFDLLFLLSIYNLFRVQCRETNDGNNLNCFIAL